MKKLLAVLFALMMVLSLSACTQPASEPEVEPAPTAANNYQDYVDAAVDTELELIMSVQGHHSWWDDKITVYAQDDDGAYFLYEAHADEELAKVLEPGALIRVTGYKAEWSGELELADANIELLSVEGKVYEPKDVTDVASDADKLKEFMNQKVAMKGLEVVKVDHKDSESDPDIYITISVNGASFDLCVENYLTGPDTEVWQTANGLEAGDVIDVEGFLYWYEGPNPHVTAITVQ